MDLGKAIKTIRVSKGLTQRQLAKAIGCSETNMLFMETGRTFPRKVRLMQFVRFGDSDVLFIDVLYYTG